MPKTAIVNEACANCGADVRPGTEFCYNCGKPVGEASEAEIDNAPPIRKPQDVSLEILEKALAASRVDAGSKDKLDLAAAERKRARSNRRRPIDVIWEPAGPNRVFFLIAILVFVIALAVVFLSRTVK